MAGKYGRRCQGLPACRREVERLHVRELLLEAVLLLESGKRVAAHGGKVEVGHVLQLRLLLGLALGFRLGGGLLSGDLLGGLDRLGGLGLLDDGSRL